jgi:hypothetical protein
MSWVWRGLVACAAFAMAGPAAAQLSLTTTRNLQFGSFVASGGGTITVDTNGARSRSGSVFLVPSSASSARLTVSDTDPANLNKIFDISLPAGATLDNGSGSTMELSNFTSDPPGSSQFLGSGQAFTVGATMTVGAGQARGVYAGSFSITVNYE